MFCLWIAIRLWFCNVWLFNRQINLSYATSQRKMSVSHTFARTKSSTAFGLLDSDKTWFIFPIKDYVKISENEPVTSFFIIVIKGLHNLLSSRVFWVPNRYRVVLWVSSLKSTQAPDVIYFSHKKTNTLYQMCNIS